MPMSVFRYLFVGLLVSVSLMLSTVWADSTRITVSRVIDSPESADFFIELLEQSFNAIGEPLELDIVELPHLRSRYYIQTGDIDLIWVLQSERRDQLYIPIPIGLTNGLIGKRLLLIRPQDQSMFDQVDQLSDLKRLTLVAGLGEGWYDVDVWQANDLPFNEHIGQWRSIYPMLSRRRVFDYFPRGMNEIIGDAERYPDLAIEKNLLLQYDRDFIFYLSPYAVHLESVLTRAITQAQDSGLIDALVQKYWGEDFAAVNFSDRKVLKMQVPDSASVAP